jgi:peptidyl-prolyl cis-trans isomerase SurA
MKKRFFSFVLTALLISPVTIFAQSNDPVVMKINGKDIKKSEFEYIYNKNNNEESIDKKSLEEYVELFKNFKLKVAEAESQGLDTTAAFLSEFMEYRTQLVKPYLDDLKANDDLISKEYDRMKELVEVSHILIAFPETLSGNFKTLSADTLEVYNKAVKARNRILKGEKFEKVAAELSDDAQSKSATRPGYLGWFPGLTLHLSLEEAAFTTPVGKISQLVRTNFGYHIIKVHDKKENPDQMEPLANLKEKIADKLANGGYLIPLFEQSIENLKTDYAFRKEATAYQALISFATSHYPSDSEFYTTFEKNKDVLFKLGDEPYVIAEFIEFLKKNPRSFQTVSTDLLADRLQYFEYSSLLDYKTETLENKYPEFKNLMQEYHDGILMFEISNREVWEKAAEDVTGLNDYFQRNKQEYTWEEPHYKGYIVLTKDAKIQKKMKKEISKLQPEAAADYLIKNYANADASSVKIEKGLFKKGDNTLVDEAAFKSGIAQKPEGFQDFFLIGKTLNAPESYGDVKGLVITNYQDYLEKEWLKTLNEKYPVTIYRDVLITIK